jgi:GTP diphosphokinase / guanosine-3',5'-bis(diphosphate) 3'-diphosphatase
MNTFKTTFEEVRADFAAFADKQDVATKEKLILATALAIHAHTGQKRKSAPGIIEQPYIIHPIRVMLILAIECGRTNIAMLTGSILHDAIEDGQGRVTLNMIRKQFGEAAEFYVDILTKPAGPMSDVKQQAYYDRILAAPEEVREIKFADRLDNLLDALQLDDKTFQLKQLKETRKYFPPIMKVTKSPLCYKIKRLCSELERRLA